MEYKTHQIFSWLLDNYFLEILCVFVCIVCVCVCVCVYVCVCVCVCVYVWSVCTNNRVHCSVLLGRGGLGIRVVLLCISAMNINCTNWTCSNTRSGEQATLFYIWEIFNWSSDLKGHKCLAQRSLPIKHQHRAIQCPICHHWLHSKGRIRSCL